MSGNPITHFNKRVTNRVLGRFAGTPHGPFALVRHVGRRSGKAYETPIIVRRAGDAFVIALTYGDSVDWYRNLLAAGQGTLRWHARTYAIGKPEPLDRATALRAFPAPQQFILRLVGIQHFARMPSTKTTA
jgi:deazaflavin-dependent oxidoreductase (nitroreductase family)